MKQIILILASLALATLPAMPARATLLAETPPAVDNMECLTLLFTNPDEHAAKCGGPFTEDEGTDPLVKGNYTQGCPLIGMTPLSLVGDEWRLRVAGPVTCCNVTYLLPAKIDLTVGEVFRFRVAC